MIKKIKWNQQPLKKKKKGRLDSQKGIKQEDMQI